MLQGLRSLLATLAGPGGSWQPGKEDPRVAAAAILFHLMDADGIRDGSEERKLRLLLSEAFRLDAEELDALLSAGEEAEAEAVDLHGFTSILMRHWNTEQRTEFIGQLWGLVFADGHLHELEDHTLWRVADLLGIDGRDRVEARRRAAAAARTLQDQG